MAKEWLRSVETSKSSKGVLKKRRSVEETRRSVKQTRRSVEEVSMKREEESKNQSSVTEAKQCRRSVDKGERVSKKGRSVKGVSKKG